MNILLFDFLGSYIQSDLIACLTLSGHHCDNISYSLHDKYQDDAFTFLMKKRMQNTAYACVITTNFYPVVAKQCYLSDIPYLSWSYDCPMNLTDVDTFSYPSNYIFLFDREDYHRYRDMGFTTIYHLPLAVNTARLSQIPYPQSPHHDSVSFVGSLYDSTLPALKSKMTSYDRGYIDALVSAQRNVYGAYFIEDLLNPSLIDSIRTSCQSILSSGSRLTKAELSYAIATSITHLERISLLRLFADFSAPALYTRQISDETRQLLPGIKICPPVSYEQEMPCVFHNSLINLNPTLKCIRSGIPLRALDILGSGGFLLSSYQPELAEHFESDCELVLYESLEDAAEKGKFYLAHNSLREKIARNGYEKVCHDFTYPDRIHQMFQTAGLN